MSGWWRIGVFFLLGIAGVGCALYWTTLSHVERTLDRRSLDELMRAATLGASSLDPLGDDLPSSVSRLGATLPFRFTLFDSNGRILADSMPIRAENSGGLAGGTTSRPEVLAARDRGTGSSIRFSTSLAAEMTFAAVRVPGSEWILRAGALRIARSELGRRILTDFAVAGSFLFVALMFIAVLARGRILRSQNKLLSWMGQIAAGESVQRFPLVTRAPLGALARSLESLAERTQDRIEQLEGERDHLSTVLSSMVEGVLVVDCQGRISDSNRAFREMFHVQGPPRGRQPLEVLRLASVAERIGTALKTGVGAWEEIQNRGRVLRVHFTPVGRPSPTSLVCVFNDITDLRRLEQLRKEFVSNVSHELRTPLTAIQGYAETLAGEPSLESLHRQFLSKIIRNAQVLSVQIDQMLNLARVEAHSTQLALEQVDFPEMVEQLRSEFAQALAAKNLLLEWSAPADPTFLADGSYIYQVFRNLLENAVKYTPGGRVGLNMERASGVWRFNVEDTGVGIPGSDLERIFERFYRVQEDGSREKRGSGIGLAIVKHIIQLHGGEVWAESQVNSGTRLHFTLPMPGSSEP